MLKELMEKPQNKQILDLLKRHDYTSYEHSYNVAQIAEQMLPYFSFKDNIEKEKILEGALLHDIGKIFIPDCILKKQGKLTAFERDLIKYHPKYGLSLLKGRDIVIKNICLMHHEHLDGTGYPQQLVNSFIPDYCRFVTAIDVIEALISTRPYKKAYTLQEVSNEIEKMNNDISFDMSYFKKIYSILANASQSLALEA